MNTLDEDSLKYELRRSLGDRRYLHLVRRAGGTRLYVPAATKPSNLFSRRFGLTTSRILSHWFGSVGIRVPIDREAQIRDFLSQRFSHAFIARRLGMTVSGIEKTISRLDLPNYNSGLTDVKTIVRGKIDFLDRFARKEAA